ncbi:MAG: bifunctional phosphoribosylaminoimidazolecarboxamide formyltransferase/IMP cyclohydrolase [Actinomycetaceae bacterium]|nr:bifunctional phosphoribosylaminoimidazolecarboxamide formyltransferase/IMP cyclohydrolase [Actinomycetaceae bacterium]
MQVPIKRALLSVYDKRGIVDLARALHESGCEILSTGSTAGMIADAGIPVTPVSDVTGFPESFDGRVKTLHPMIHGAILANRSLETHRSQMDELGITPIDLVVVNLYPFQDTVASGASPAECIEQIDIGGPAMIRASAKNHADVAVVVSPDYYPMIVDAVQAGGTTRQQRAMLATAAFTHTATYDTAIAQWMSGADQMPDTYVSSYSKAGDLRYGENPHQKAALYTDASGRGLAHAKQLHGKEMSYNNYQDTDAAVRAAYDFDQPAVAIVKHANPCGIAVGQTIADAYVRAHACDPVSAFGGVIATNREVSVEMAKGVSAVFTEVIAAPSFAPEALEILQAKKNLRILVVEPELTAIETRPVSGGLLVQERDQMNTAGDNAGNWELVAGEAADSQTLAELEFAWRAVRSAKSNAILLARDNGAVGIGMGQVNRVDSCRLAVERANTLGEGERARGAVAASDAFFPFADGLQVLIDAGVRAVVEPGGSIRDDEVIEAAKAAGVTLYFTGVRHFAH